MLMTGANGYCTGSRGLAVMSDIAEACKDPIYLADDTLRTVHLLQRAIKKVWFCMGAGFD